MPGRVRVTVRNLKGDVEAAKSLEVLLHSQPGVNKVRASHITGNVLVGFDVATVSHEDILRDLVDLGFYPQIDTRQYEKSVVREITLSDLGMELGKRLAMAALKQALNGSPAAIILDLI